MSNNHGRPYRLPDYDYGRNGCYFVTFCTKDRENLLSDVGRGLAPGMSPELTLSPVGKILEFQLRALPQRFPTVTIDHYVIMPNHIHLLLSVGHTPGASPRPTLSQIIGACKSLTTRTANAADHHPGRIVFQASYHDHVIRNEADYLKHWQYIDDNPAKWDEDEYYTE